MSVSVGEWDDDAVQWPVGQVELEVVVEEVDRLVHVAVAEHRALRSEHDTRMASKRVVRGWRLHRWNVERGGADVPGVERGEQRVVIDGAGAAEVEEDGARLTGAERGRVEEAPRLVGRGQQVDDDSGPGQGL